MLLYVSPAGGGTAREGGRAGLFNQLCLCAGR